MISIYSTEDTVAYHCLITCLHLFTCAPRWWQWGWRRCAGCHHHSRWWQACWCGCDASAFPPETPEHHLQHKYLPCSQYSELTGSRAHSVQISVSTPEGQEKKYTRRNQGKRSVQTSEFKKTQQQLKINRNKLINIHLLDLESTAHQRSHAANLTQRLLAVDISTPGQVPQHARYHLEWDGNRIRRVLRPQTGIMKRERLVRRYWTKCSWYFTQDDQLKNKLTKHINKSHCCS